MNAPAVEDKSPQIGNLASPLRIKNHDVIIGLDLIRFRFAPHLEKCLGKGRSSSRIASQKITASTIEGHYSFNQKGEELLDGDWSGSQKEKKKTKRSKPKKNDSRSKKSKIS